MAVTPRVFGPAQIKIDVGSGLEFLGYSRSGVTILFHPRTLDVPSDRVGGESGTPADVVALGLMASVRLELTEYDTAVAAKIMAMVDNGSSGTSPTPGGLYITDGLYYRLLINSTTFPLNFPIAVPRGSMEQDRASRWSPYVCEFEMYPDPTTRLLFNTTTT